MAKWQAFRIIQPDIGDRICEILKRGFAAVANAWGAEYEPDDFEPAPDKKQVKSMASPDQQVTMMAVKHRAPDGNSNR